MSGQKKIHENNFMEQLRNKGIFIYIAKRLRALGYVRLEIKPSKYKNLKYEYRTVKYAHNSETALKL